MGLVITAQEAENCAALDCGLCWLSIVDCAALEVLLYTTTVVYTYTPIMKMVNLKCM